MKASLLRGLRAVAAATLLWACSGGLAQADTNATTDDKSVDVPTSWYTYTNLTTTQIGSLLSSNLARLTDIEPYDTAGTRFTVTMVRNSGSYAVPGWWWYVGVTPAQISSYLSSNNARLIDVEPYATSGGIRFAVVMVANTGTTARNWGWLVGVSAAQIGTYINNSNGTTSPQRLIDLKSYVEGGVKKYVIISVRNTGTDAKTWEYWFNQSSAGVTAKVNAFGGRITSLERQADGTYTLVQVKNSRTDNHYWRYYFGLRSLTLANEVAAQFGSRVFDIETYVSGGTRFYNALIIDNANTETRRIRAAFGNTLVKADGLPNGQWGAYLKPLAGSATISLNGSRRFEPASAIKAVHNLAMMQKIKSGATTLSSPLTYFVYPSDTQWDSSYGQAKGYSPNACPNPNDENSSNDAANNVNFGKDNMMAVSDNRTTRAITLYFATDNTNQSTKGISGIAALEQIAFKIGMTDTFMDQPRIGCGYADGKRNQTTLVDFGKLYEQVENGNLLGTGTYRTEFYQPMNGGTFGTSSTEGLIRGVVQAEGAALGKTSAEISDFIARMEWRHKGGGYGISCANASFTPCTNGYISISTLAGRLTLPRKGGELYALKDYVFGSYSTDLNACKAGFSASNPESCAACPTCTDGTAQGTALNNVNKELFRTIIRENLATF